MDGHDMTKLIGAFGDCVNALKTAVYAFFTVKRSKVIKQRSGHPYIKTN